MIGPWMHRRISHVTLNTHLLFFTMLIVTLLTLNPAQAQTFVPEFEEAPCPMELPDTLVEGQHITCGYVTVLANRAEPESGTYRLAVVILKAKSADPQPDPVIFLTGGPGNGALGFEGYWSTFPTLENRDFILVDPRGTGFSEPDMDCSEIEFPTQDTSDSPATNEARREATLTWNAACRDLLQSRGIDLTQFNTVVWSADIADLRTALGLGEINLFGVSYGAYWTLGIVRDHPEGVRTITLDSVSPPPIDHFGETGLRADATFNLLFQACTSDPACAARFPTMTDDFYGFVERLREQPVRLPTTEVNWTTDASFVASAFNALYFVDRYSILPLALEQLKAENWEVAVQLGEQVNNLGVGQAVFNSVICHDEIPFTAPDAFDNTRERHPYLSNWLYDSETFMEICKIWGAGQADAVESQPVESDVPALILTGTFDPTTPPAYGRVAAETLPNSTFVEFPTLAHAVTFYADCPRFILAAFVDDPAAAPDTSCIGAMLPLRFETDIVVNRGVFQMAKNLMLETNIPVAGAAGLSALTFGIALVALPVHGWRTRTISRSRVATIHRVITWLLALTSVAFIVSLMMVVMQTAQVNQNLLLFGLPREGMPVFILMWASLVVLAIMLVVFLVRGRIERRVYPVYLVFTIISIIFAFLLGSWGMFG